MPSALAAYRNLLTAGGAVSKIVSLPVSKIVSLPCHADGISLMQNVLSLAVHAPTGTPAPETGVRVAVLVPCYNEALTIADVVRGHVIRRMFADVEADVHILVDGDATYDAAAAPEMMRRLVEEGLDMVSGIRMEEDAGARGVLVASMIWIDTSAPPAKPSRATRCRRNTLSWRPI